MVELEVHAEGLVLPVKAAPGARKNAVTGEHQGALKVAITQAPEKGKANKALAEVLCKALQLKRSQLELLSGETSSSKRFLVRGVEKGELLERLGSLLQ